MNTEATTEICQNLIDSIEALKDEDYSVCSGFRTDIYLDPEEGKVYTFVGSNSHPRSAHHNIDRHILRVDDGAIAESVYDAVKSIESNLDDLLDLYLGSEWNGSNDIGQWDERSVELEEYIAEALSSNPIASYWLPGDWFEGIMDELKTSWAEGKTAIAIIDEQGCGDTQDGMVDRDDAIAWLESQFSEWESEDDYYEE